MFAFVVSFFAFFVVDVVFAVSFLIVFASTLFFFVDIASVVAFVAFANIVFVSF